MQGQGLAKTRSHAHVFAIVIVINRGSVDHYWVPFDRNDSNQSIVLQLFTGMTTESETRFLVHGKNDLAISSRSTDFNVQISAFNIDSHCSQMFGQTISLI